jgi:16S rRNA (cytosine967-C5)-methyltransferase
MPTDSNEVTPKPPPGYSAGLSTDFSQAVEDQHEGGGLLRLAARTLATVGAGTRSADALAHSIEQAGLGAEQAERLSSLVYGALRRRRRVEQALGGAGEPAERQRGHVDNDERQRGHVDNDEWLGTVCIASALLGQGIPLELAGALRPRVDWSRVLEADSAARERAPAVQRVALLGSLPDFLAERLCAEYGAEAQALAASLSEPPPRTLRVNTLLSTLEQAQARLSSEGAELEPGKWAKTALALRGAFNPFRTRAFHAGVFELQDEGSQIASELVAPPPGGVIVDACAGAGGKSLALAALLQNRGKVLALDVNDNKLGELKRRAKRARARNVQSVRIAAQGAFPAALEPVHGRAARVLVDAPCSGTGVLRRNPELRQTLRPDTSGRMAELELAILERMLPLLAPGGRLLYVTCSLLRAEGEEVMDALEACHPELTPVDLAGIYDRAYVERFTRSAPHRMRLLPHWHACDGFFVACLRLRR